MIVGCREAETPSPPPSASPTTTIPAQTKTPEPTDTAVPTGTHVPTHTPVPTATPAVDFETALVPLALSPEQLARLFDSGVVASPRKYAEFDYLYRETAYANLPVFVTSDSLLHIVHLIFDQTLRSLEEHAFLPNLQALNQILLAQAETQYQ